MKLLLNQIVQALAQMRTAIALLALAAGVSVLGTLVPQGLALEGYVSRYGAGWAQLLWFSGITDIFRAWWYLGIWVILLTSVLACLVRNGPRIFQQVWVPRQVPKVGDHGFVQIKAPCMADLRTAGLRYAGDVQGYAVWQGGVLNRIGYFAVHLGIIGVAVAGLLTGLVGWRGMMNIREGETERVALIWHGGTAESRLLPFRVRNDGLQIEYYRSGHAKFYQTQLSFLDKTGTFRERTAAAVNTPARLGPWYGGYMVYQASYGDGGSRIQGRIMGGDPQEGWPLESHVYEQVKLADGTRIMLLDARTATPVVKGEGLAQNAGPSLDYRVEPPAGPARQVRAYVDHPRIIGLAGAANSEGVVPYLPVALGLDLSRENAGLWAIAGRLAAVPENQLGEAFKNEIRPVLAGVAEAERALLSSNVLQAAQVLRELGVVTLVRPERMDLRYYSGLQVVYDPGAWVFWISAVVLALGVVLMLGRRLVRVWVAGDGTHALVSSPHGARVVQEMVGRLTRA